jgi:hypothetical protein
MNHRIAESTGSINELPFILRNRPSCLIDVGKPLRPDSLQIDVSRTEIARRLLRVRAYRPPADSAIRRHR